MRKYRVRKYERRRKRNAERGIVIVGIVCLLIWIAALTIK